MIFEELELSGAYLIVPERHEDERGFFARTWCDKTFEERGLNPKLVQCDISYNKRQGTLRGMHYQAAPFQECKLIRSTRGSAYDVIIDLRADSPTFKRSFGFELCSEKRNMLYVPEGFAHGYLTLEDDTEIFYQMSQYYCPESSRGVRWNDPAFGIKWPDPVLAINERDNNFPNFLQA